MPRKIAGGAASWRHVSRMLDTQKHRGPDANSVWAQGGLALGHRRLAILDLSDAGRQPMHSQDGRWTIVFNGEIFNYREIRDQLGGNIKTGTDTEVLLEACAKWGVERTLARTHGMFAFALWDSVRQELTLARDRAGEKPLVYFWNGETLAFASEMKALAEFHDRRLDPTAVDAYLALGYIPAPLAAIKNCRKLPAGHLIRFRSVAHGTPEEIGNPVPKFAIGQVPQPERWWIAPNGAEQKYRSNEALVDDLRARVGEAVRIRLRADVLIALSLSGGVDSSVIAAECVRQGAQPEAFTVRIDGDETDLPYARQVASGLGLKHTVVDLSAKQVASHFNDVLFHYDEPFADSSSLACFALGEALSGRYRVVLDGDGGDEAFGGYRHYEYIGVKQTLKAAAAAAGFCDGVGSGRAGVYVQSKSLFRASDRKRLMADHGGQVAEDWLREVLSSSFGEMSAHALQRALRTDRELALANGLTYKMDIALSAFGIEGRAPLLDHAVLEWGQTLPARELVRGREKKVLLRRAYADDLPHEVLHRPKHGFGAPVDRWMDGPLQKSVEEMVPCPWFAEAAQCGVSGQRQWTLFAFSAWAERWGARW